MAQRKALTGLVKAKLNLVTAQKDELHETLNSYVDKVTAIAKSALETEGQDLNRIREANTMLEKVYECLVGLEGHMDEDTPQTRPSDSDATTVSPSSSLSLSELSSAMSQREARASEASEVFKLHHRIEVLELALTACRGELCQTIAQQAEKCDDMDSRYHTLEEKLENIATDKSEAEKHNSLRHQSIEEKFERFEASSQRQIQRLQSVEDRLLELETSNTDVAKQQESRLGTVENLISKMDEKVLGRLEEVNSDRMLQTEQKLNELEGKQTDTEKLYINRVDEVEKHLKEIKQNKEDMVKQADKKLVDLLKRVKKLETSDRQDFSRLESLVKDVNTLKTQYSKRQQSSKLHNLEERVESLDIQCCSLQEQVENFKHLKQETEEITSRMSTLADKGDLIDVMKTSRSLKSSLDVLVHRADVVEQSVKSVVSYREKEENKRRELEVRICVVETKRRTDLGHYAKKVNEVNSLFKQVCHMVDHKVEPLRRLHCILNDFHKRVEKREELSLRVNEVRKEVEDISRQVQSLETKQQQPPAGFTAYYQKTIRVPDEGSIITDYTNVLCNEGGHYDPTTGEFTAPQDGLYITSVTLRQKGEGIVTLRVVRNCRFQFYTPRQAVCRSSTSKTETSGCGLAVVRLKAGDTLSVRVCKVRNDPKLSTSSSFSCFAL